MLQRVRESLALILLALLPLHALLVTVGTKVIAGPGHAPLSALAFWKEGVLGLILMLALIEAVSGQLSAVSKWKFDLIDGIVATLLLIAALLLVADRSPLSAALYGFRYDFIAPLAFLILRRVTWSEVFVRRAKTGIVAIGSAIAVYGIVTLLLPESFFRALGYSDLPSLYVPGGPLAAFQQLGGSALRRMQSTMSGPNQLGLWLLLPWSIALSNALVHLQSQGRVTNDQVAVTKRGKNWWSLLWILLSAAIVLTFSRSAWIGATVAGTLILWRHVPRSLKLPLFSMIGSFGLILIFSVLLLYPEVLLRAVSNQGHIERPLQAIQKIIAQPLGYGLGTAGPASNRISDACVYLEPGSDASWAAPHPQLCVFVGDTQVQPVDRTCTCPFLPENWYLQIGVELGVIGMILWIALTVLVLRKLWSPSNQYPVTSLAVFGVFLGISIASLFLHAWEDSAVAYSVWILSSVACAAGGSARSKIR